MTKINVCTDEEAEQADAVICCRKGGSADSYFSDNLEGVCVCCGHEVIFRPHAPKTPPRVCIECMMDGSAKNFLSENGCN